MNRLYILLTYLLFSSALSLGQDSTVTLRRVPRSIVKLAPLSLLDQDATVQGGLEYRTGAKTSVQAEFGYGWKGLSPFTADLDDYVKAEVWRTRAEVRFYNGRYRTNRRRDIAIKSSFPLGNYWAIEALSKRINVINQEFKWQDPSSSAKPEYVGSMRISRYVLGTHLKIGRQFAFYDPIHRSFSRTLLDIYLGAGVRWAFNDIADTGTPPHSYCGCGLGRSFTQKENQLTPSITAGLKVGFAL
ncbi:hypothetical protein ACFSUS_25980 [Spirosoma soli]|uniref:DUF3575 domain-containing protein n=1 Tax=Spirosoma soli TaxID=1770529 RepID=A0ABW5MCI8_9BACT